MYWIINYGLHCYQKQTYFFNVFPTNTMKESFKSSGNPVQERAIIFMIIFF